MIDNEILNGIHNQWKLIKLLGEGDAGEIFLVESLRDRQVAILKRPHASSFSSDIVRQATAISAEATILKSLAEAPVAGRDTNVRPAYLLDQSLPGNELSERYFIIIEKANGLNLGLLERLLRFGYNEAALQLDTLDVPSRLFLQKLSETGEIPTLILLRVINGLFELLEALHTHPVQVLDSISSGIVWNDVKPDHLFWDPAHACLTVIDWGNGQLLEADGVSKDRLYSPVDDYRQLVEAMGKFLSQTAPGLHTDLKWPASITPAEASPQGLAALREDIKQRLRKETAALLEVRRHESRLVTNGTTSAEQVKELDAVQGRIILYGELPDYGAAARLYSRLASALVQQGELEDFLEVCTRLAATAVSDVDKWKTLSQITSTGLDLVAGANGDRASREADLFKEALLCGMEDRWTAALWTLCQATRRESDLTVWRSLSSLVRRLIPEINTGTPTPYVAAQRLAQMLDDENLRLTDQFTSAMQAGALEDPQGPHRLLTTYDAILARYKNEVLRKWPEVEPAPPGGDLSYASLEAVLSELNELMPRLGLNPNERLGPLARALSQARAQTEILLDAWQAQGFKTAQQGLHNLLLWDPDRRRVLQAEQAVAQTPFWIEEVRTGPRSGETLVDYAIRMEFTGRDLRSRVGSAHWLESALGVFAELRSGRRPGDLLDERPGLVDDLPWLRKFERKPEVSLPKVRSADRIGKAAPGSHIAANKPETHVLPSLTEVSFGQGQDLFLTDPLDAWVPEARGSSARVFLGFLRNEAGQLKQAAVKVMRPDKAEYALPLYWEEAQILSLLTDTPGVVRWLECGFIKSNSKPAYVDGLPSEHEAETARGMSGRAVRLLPADLQTFQAELEPRANDGWLPYLALEKKSSQDNLMLLCDSGYTRGQFLPVNDGVNMAAQICQIIQAAHEKNVVYRDHKLLHYYWNPSLRRISVIDWNVAKWHPQGLTDSERQFDLVQFGARTMHHIFTGRPAAGALPAGPTSPAEIEMAPHTYPVYWTYDDLERLPEEVRQILAKLLAGGYDHADQLREDLLIQMRA